MQEEKTVISISHPTPKWATYVFRTVINLTLAAAIWIAGTNLLSSETKFELMLALKALDYFVWGAGRMIGVKKTDFEDTNQNS